MSRSLQRAGTALILVAALSACAVDEAMRRVDVLDRIFEPERFRTSPAPQVAVEAPPAPEAGPPKDPIPPPTAWLQAEPRSPWDAAEPLPAPDGLPQAVSPEAPVAALPVPEAPLPEAQVANPAPVDPAVRTAALLRQNPWISRFWSQLSAAEQGRVSRALTRRDGSAPSPAAAWDPMGLQERVELLFGRVRATS